MQVLDKLEGGQDIHGADIALKRHEAIRTDVEARVSIGDGGWGGINVEGCKTWSEGLRGARTCVVQLGVECFWCTCLELHELSPDSNSLYVFMC